MITAVVWHHGGASKQLAPLVQAGKLARVVSVIDASGKSSVYEAGAAQHLNTQDALLLCGFSAGCAGVRGALRVLEQRGELGRVAGVVLLDGAHASTGATLADAKTRIYLGAGERAAKGGAPCYWSASSIEPPTFASTRYVLGLLAQALNREPFPVGTTTLGRLRVVVAADQDHVAQAGRLFDGATWCLGAQDASQPSGGGWFAAVLVALGLGWLWKRPASS